MEELQKSFKGSIKTDDETLRRNSSDASIFEMRPEMVVSPKDVADLKTLVHYTHKRKSEGVEVSLTARNGGSCMSGGSLTEGIVVNMSEHFTHIGEVDEKARTLSVQGGVMHLQVEKATHPKGLYFAPYTSSHDFCGIGGMLGNNASGEKSVKYGPTSKNVDHIKVLLADGEVYDFGPLTSSQVEKKKQLPTFEGKLYREITKLIDDNWHLIDHNHPRVKKNAAGYALWELWDEQRKVFNMARLFIGSQGTLGIITEAELHLVPFAKFNRMIVTPIANLHDLATVVQTMMLGNPETCETFDIHTYELAKQLYPEDAARAMAAEGQHLIVFGIFAGDTQQMADTAAGHVKDMLEHNGYRVDWIDDPAVFESYLLIRRKSFKMLLDNPHPKARALPFLEDTIVAIEHYGEFLAALETILSGYDMTYTYAGHIGDGSIRLVPLGDVESEGARERIMELASRVYELVFAFGGSMSVDHNDGLIRTIFLERMYGSEMVSLFARIKELFDPSGIFNPNKKVGGSYEHTLEHIVRSNR